MSYKTIQDLPSELVVNIFTFTKSLVLRETCKKYNDIYKNNILFICGEKLGVKDINKWDRARYFPRRIFFFNCIKNNEIVNVKIILNNFIHNDYPVKKLFKYCVKNRYIQVLTLLFKYFNKFGSKFMYNNDIKTHEHDILRRILYPPYNLKNIRFLLKEPCYSYYVDTRTDDIFGIFLDDKEKSEDTLQMLIEKKLVENHWLVRSLFSKKLKTSEILLKYFRFNTVALNMHGKHARTPLMISIYNGYDDIAKTLIKSRVSLNAIDDVRCTALHHVCDRRPVNYEIIKLLIKFGVNEGLRDSKGLRAFEYLV